MSFEMTPIGFVRGGRRSGEDDYWGPVRARIDLELEVEGLDAIDGTPVLDVKPYMQGFAPRGEVREPEWATELMASYW